jgi:rhamnogalacturonyl hydrolase YesR
MLIRNSYPVVDAMRLQDKFQHPHKATVAAYALAVGVELGEMAPDVHHACYAALQALLHAIRLDIQRYRLGALDEKLLMHAVDVVRQVQAMRAGTPQKSATPT